MSITTSGLLLQSTPYLGKKKILKIFSREQGLVSLFSTSCTLTPFCVAEWVYPKTEKEMKRLQDVTLTDPLLHIRESYTVISAAGVIAQDLLRTQLPNKSAPELFDLTLLYLKNLHRAPDRFTASFHLKLLVYEGLLSPDPDPHFSVAEWSQVETLAFSRSLTAIQNVGFPPFTKIKSLFDERF